MQTQQPTSIKEINQFRILGLLRSYPGISRAEIVDRTGLGKATISSLVARMIGDELVVEEGVGEQTATAERRPIKNKKRRNIKLKMNSLARLAIGVELSGTDCVAALTDLYSNPLQIVRQSIPDNSVPASISAISKSLETLLLEHDPSKLLGVGIGVPGPVDVARRRVLQAENLGWFDVPFADLAEAQLGVPTSVVKRQHAGALGEYWYGVGRGCQRLIYISIGVGIGCGIILEGELYSGANGTAGEIGHISVVPDGHRCRCGNFGCLETVASTPAIVLRVKEKLRKGRSTSIITWPGSSIDSITIDKVIVGAQEGDPVAVEAMQEAARYLGGAIATVVNLYNPSLIILGGKVVELGDLFLKPIREEVLRRSFSLSLADLEIVPSSLGEQAVPIGAATLVIDRLFRATNQGFLASDNFNSRSGEIRSATIAG